MKGELLGILAQLEREKGIDKEVLIEAIESALVTAVRKIARITNPQAEVRVEINRSTGKIEAYINGEEMATDEFGRIAAQTARQVIIQKIREAEKENIFTEYTAKLNQIVSGSVYKVDTNSIIVDFFGKCEGILPRKFLSPLDDFKVGERIKVLVIEVRKEAKGAKVILSRTQSLFVKKLFELEVPEIYEGIVEIKSVSRQPGERTKIAVWSKDEKVDSVGACVGMKGTRVKNIVQELRGEKVDIIRYSEDSRQFISNALQPAKISQIILDRNNKKATVIVPEDNLSLAIGKHGQNVRLASKLVEWVLDIRTKKMLDEVYEEGMELKKIKGIGKKIVDALMSSGIKSLKDLAGAELEDLVKVKGVGKKKAEDLKQEAQRLIGEGK